MKKYLLSIIIPTFNNEKTIQRLLDSINNQSFKNFEVIVVDDGSCDSTKEILNNYKVQKNYNIVFSKHVGSYYARNIGILKSNAQYICFADADDYFDENAFENYVKIINKNKPDLIISGYYEDAFNKNLKIRKPKDNFYHSKKDFANDIIKLYKNNLIHNVWNKCYKKEIITKNKITFPSLYFGEDHLFNIEVLKTSKNIVTLNKATYHYVRMQKGSITNQYIPDLFNSRLLENNCIKNLFAEFNLPKMDYEVFLAKRYLLRLTTVLENIHLKGESSNNRMSEIKVMLSHDMTLYYLTIYRPHQKLQKWLIKQYKKQNINTLYYLGKLINFTKKVMPKLYIKIKSNR